MNLRPLLFNLWRWLPIPLWVQWRVIWLIVPKFMVGAVAVILDDTGKILLFHHTYRKDYPWGLPGGWLNHNEDAVHALIREMHEEAGITITVQQPLFVGTSRQYPRIDLFFLCRHVAGEFTPSDEVLEAQFVEVEELEAIMEPQMYLGLTRALAELKRDSDSIPRV